MRQERIGMERIGEERIGMVWQEWNVEDRREPDWHGKAWQEWNVEDRREPDWHVLDLCFEKSRNVEFGG